MASPVTCWTPLKSLFSPKRHASQKPGPKQLPNEIPTSSASTCFHNIIPCESAHSPGKDIWSLQDQEEGLPAYQGPGIPFGKCSPPWFAHEIVQTIDDRIDELSPALRELSLKIHGESYPSCPYPSDASTDHPELMWQEHYAHDTLTEFMASYGFSVQKHYLGIETAWRADFQHQSSTNAASPIRTLGLNSEMDALPGIGHACGHNLIAIAGVAVAVAAKTVLERHDISGNIVLLGTPAEEGGAGKVKLIEGGGYKDMDICLMCHPGPGPKNSTGTGSALSVTSIEVEFFGHSSHASAAPWEGQNALDAAFLAYSAVSVLRQQIRPDHRVHGIIEGRNWAPNIIPDYAKMRWMVRAPAAAQVEVLQERVINCFKGAAQASGCRIEIKTTNTLYDLRQNGILTHEYQKIVQDQYGMSLNSVEGAIGGSTDFGNVTYELPSLHPSFAIPTQPNGGNHTPGFTEAARTKKAHECTLRVSKALAQLGLRAIMDEEFLKQVKDAFNPGK